MSTKVKKITMSQLAEKVARLRTETGLPITVEAIPGEKVHKINLVYTAGISRYALLEEPLSVREAGKAIDTITLMCQMKVRFPNSANTPRLIGDRLTVNTNITTHTTTSSFLPQFAVGTSP